MKPFMDQDFLLQTPTAQTLYHEYAAALPIVDYHCHISPEAIANNHAFKNITEVWLGGDHYKWRLMRANGIDEKFITGDASDKEKFLAWAETLPGAIGNPVYHWSHLELQRYFGYEGQLNPQTAETVWELCNSKLRTEAFRVRGLIESSNVAVICTTDDPTATLEWHKKIAADASFKTKVLPTFRPDRAMNLEKDDYLTYLEELAAAAETPIKTLADLQTVIQKRLDYFAAVGCCISDHAVDFVPYVSTTPQEIEGIFQKRLAGQIPTAAEETAFKTAFLHFVGSEYSKRDWAMQIHYGCKRNNNTKTFLKLGPDTGYDCINNYAPSQFLADFLNSLEKDNALPRTIIYSLNPNDNASIVTVAGCFQDASTRGKVQHGSAWWFNDHKKGMEEQLENLASVGYLGNFIGMLTDSRSFLSYPRHEYFRRILCNLIANWVENGEYPADQEALKKIVQDISAYNALRYFKWK